MVNFISVRKISEETTENVMTKKPSIGLINHDFFNVNKEKVKLFIPSSSVETITSDDKAP